MSVSGGAARCFVRICSTQPLKALKSMQQVVAWAGLRKEQGTQFRVPWTGGDEGYMSSTGCYVQVGQELGSLSQEIKAGAEACNAAAAAEHSTAVADSSVAALQAELLCAQVHQQLLVTSASCNDLLHAIQTGSWRHSEQESQLGRGFAKQAQSLSASGLHAGGGSEAAGGAGREGERAARGAAQAGCSGLRMQRPSCGRDRGRGGMRRPAVTDFAGRGTLLTARACNCTHQRLASRGGVQDLSQRNTAAI